MRAPGCADVVPGLLGGHATRKKLIKKYAVCAISCILATVSPFIFSSLYACDGASWLLTVSDNSWGRQARVFIFMS